MSNERKEAPRAAPSARGAPGPRRAWVLLAVLFGACTAPKPATPPDSWGAVTRLPGVFAHAGVVRDGVLWIGGERAGHEPPAVMLSVDVRSGRVLSTIDVPAARVRSVRLDESGALWAGGQTDAGRAFLAVRRGMEWLQVSPPPDALMVDALMFASGRVIASVETGAGAALEVRSKAGSWTLGHAIRSEPGGSARLPALAVAGGRIVAAGTDGRSAIVLESHDDAGTFRMRALAGGAAANAVTETADRVCGTSSGVDGGARAVIWQVTGSGWTPHPLPDLVSCVAIETAPGALVAAGATGGGDVVLVSDDDGTSWSVRDPADPGSPAVLEGLVIAGGRAFAYGTGAVYAGPG